MDFVGSNFVMCITLLMVLGCIGTCNGKKVYKVGDSAGWTTLGNVNYKQWATNKTFQVGDVIVFNYNPKFHNVMQVTHANYKACNVTAPIAVHTTGNDTVKISSHGHRFFICGVPGHCQSGQKVDINVLRSVSSNDHLLSPAPAPLAASSYPATAASTTAHLAAPAPSPVSNAPASLAPTKIAAKTALLMLGIGVSLINSNESSPNWMRPPNTVDHLINGDSLRLRQEVDDENAHDDDPSREEDEDERPHPAEHRQERLCEKEGEEHVGADGECVAGRPGFHRKSLAGNQPPEWAPRPRE
ncbi:hypothetical protein V2J09_014186 [Rumex salicifolius]